MSATLLLGIVDVNGGSFWERQAGLTGTVVSVLLDSCVLSWTWLTACFVYWFLPLDLFTESCGFSLVPPDSPVGLLWVTSLFQHWPSFGLPLFPESPCVLSLTRAILTALCVLGT